MGSMTLDPPMGAEAPPMARPTLGQPILTVQAVTKTFPGPGALQSCCAANHPAGSTR